LHHKVLLKMESNKEYLYQLAEIRRIASRFTHHELYWAGVTQILLGLVALALSRYALFFWAVGFGGVHIVYGLYIYYAHERESRNSRR